MCTQFSRAIARVPSDNFADGVTTSQGAAPDVALARAQHAAYVAALRDTGLAVDVLPADPRHPDSVFVEDAALIVGDAAIITRPGAPTRAGETAAIAEALGAHFPDLKRITAPGTVDGGDICETDAAVLIGVSARTNEAGARQLAAMLEALGRVAELIDIRQVPGLLHLKTGMGYLGDGRLALAPEVPDLAAFARFEVVRLDPAEAYAANCVRVNDKVLIPTGAPRFADRLAALGYTPLALDMSEFRKMDGGLSCLSLRF
jgi:dimethylargininase